jgi:hypothetical protein
MATVIATPTDTYNDLGDDDDESGMMPTLAGNQHQGHQRRGQGLEQQQGGRERQYGCQWNTFFKGNAMDVRIVFVIRVGPDGRRRVGP